jgi:hypothetical protein
MPWNKAVVVEIVVLWTNNFALEEVAPIPT